MCGIIGYVGPKQASEILIEGLKKLEYRGYDSAGIAVFNGEKIVTEKTKGRLLDLEKKLKCDGAPSGHVGIGHTRWATHGEPSDVNSHPHSFGRVTLVHNGIIENYLAIKQQMIELGHSFASQTDTETVAHLVDYNYKGDPLDAIIKTISQIRGSYALAIMFSDIPNKLYAVRKDSPLIVGIGEDENFIASDIPAILTRTRNYYLIEENEISEITKDGITIYDTDKNHIIKEVQTAYWDIEAAEKGGYEHFMLKEIHEQPKALRAAIHPRLQNGISGILKEEINDTTGIKRIIVVACGSAMHTGLLFKYATERLARVPVEVYIASEFRYCDPIMRPGDAVLAISQSGETADTLAGIRLAKSHGIPVYAIVNAVGSSISREADYTIYTWAGPEIAVATTKAFTNQTAVSYLLTIRLALDRGKIDEARAKELTDSLLSIPDKVQNIIDNMNYYNEMAKLNKNVEDMFFIGRGQDYAMCCEGSLKMKEISYVHSECYAAGELKHGTISLITSGTPCIASVTEDALAEKTISNIKEVKARGGYVILFHRDGIKVDNDYYDVAIKLPSVDEMLMPILSIVPLQIFAYYTAIHKGCDVDKPRNLAKSVTVE